MNKLTVNEMIDAIKKNYPPPQYSMLMEALDHASKLMKAESEGRLVVLPCKVGDTLYEIDLPEYGVIVCKVMWMILKNDVSVQVEVTDGHGLGSGYCFELSDFGKTVFRTREEAEAKLKECGE